MQAWQRLGRFLAGHMLVIIPMGLAIGVFFPQTLSWMKPAVPVLFALMTYQNSLGNEVSGLRDVLRRPAPLLIALVFVHVFVPLLAFGLGTLLFSGAPHGSDILTGFALEYAVPVGSSTIMWISLFGGDISLGLATLLVSTLLAPFSIPATVKLLVGASVTVDTVGMMRDMIFMIALPAIAGTATNELTHGWGKQTLSPALSPLARILLPLIVSINSTGISSFLFHLTPSLVEVMLFVLFFSVFGYTAGFLIGLATRQPRGRFIALTFSCGVRNISAGAVIAMRYFPAATLFPVMIGTLFQQFLAALSGRVMERYLAAHDAPAVGTGESDQYAH
ncbi:MAG: bile acid:sodium symporter family protein [Olegusella sp.]|nr:bile acid:sodium symporter family protein [Olegusella sp.]